ncbi:nitroreductase [Candidatus Woesearchaeota archaeon]|nr:MAG: nitroreductase [Candidatus Woesearchaeota archaeon]
MRTKEYNCDDLFVNRWSPRTFTGESISDEQLMALFEAARWAPSSFNEQPWRIIYAKRDTPSWDKLFDLLAEPNKAWCKHAAALFVFVSSEHFTHNNKPNRTHSYCTGAAWMSFALQASLMGLAAHGMAGFDYDRAKKELNIPDGFCVEAMAAVGVVPPTTSEEKTDRKPVKEFIFEGSMKEHR